MRSGQRACGKVSALQVPVPPSLRIRHTTAWVYTPPGYHADSDTPYPALYLLHGSPGRSVDWIAAGLPALLDRMMMRGRVRPSVVIAPDVRAGLAVESSSLDSTRGGPQVETYLTRFVVPWAHRQFALRDDPVFRGIGGMSSGAFGALNQGLRHPETFGTILAVSPYGHPGRGGRRQLSTLEQVAAHSPNAYVDTIALSPQTGVFLAYGAWEERFEAGRTARDLGSRLVARGVDVRVDRVPRQGHTWRMAMTAAPAALEFFEHRMAAAG